MIQKSEIFGREAYKINDPAVGDYYLTVTQRMYGSPGVTNSCCKTWMQSGAKAGGTSEYLLLVVILSILRQKCDAQTDVAVPDVRAEEPKFSINFYLPQE
jgi:hypothetical protein